MSDSPIPNKVQLFETIFGTYFLRKIVVAHLYRASYISSGNPT